MFKVIMEFPTDEAREHAVEWFTARTLPDGEFVQDHDGDAVVLERAQSADAAVARATALLQGALDGTDHEASDVRLSVADGPV